MLIENAPRPRALFSLRYALLTLFLAPLLPPAALANQTVSLNGDFESSGSCTGSWDTLPCPTGYIPYRPDPARTTIGLQTLHDNKAMKIAIAQSAESYTRAGFYQEVLNPTAGDVYRFSVLVKAEAFRGDIRLQVYERDGQGAARPTQEQLGPRGTSGWQRLTFTKPVSADTSRIVFTVLASTDGTLCPSGDCGETYYDNFTIQKLSGYSGGETKALENPCADGEFLNTTSRICLPLDKSFGFSREQFDLQAKSLEITVSGCDEAGVRSALSQAELNGGGTITLEACTYTFDDEFEIPSNTILRGAGSGRTILKAANWSSPSFAFVRVENYALTASEPLLRPGRQNVVIQDLSITTDPDTSSVNGLGIYSSANVLVERVELSNAGRSNLDFRHSQNITLRYISSHGVIGFHAIGAKDCYPETAPDPDMDGLISLAECENGELRFWTENLTVASNHLTDGHSGLDLHTSLTEIAGNIISNNLYGSKFPEPARKLWIHDNVFAHNTEQGSASKTQYCGRVDASMRVADHAYYRNRYQDNGVIGKTFGWRADQAENILLLDNTYAGNGQSNQWRIDDHCGTSLTTVAYCPGDGISAATLIITPNSPAPTALPATADACDPADIAHVFD